MMVQSAAKRLYVAVRQRGWRANGQRWAIGIADGGEPADYFAGQSIGIAALGHDVSILIGSGVAEWRGVCPCSNTSMTSMRPPQQAQARG